MSTPTTTHVLVPAETLTAAQRLIGLATRWHGDAVPAIDVARTLVALEGCRQLTAEDVAKLDAE